MEHLFQEIQNDFAEFFHSLSSFSSDDLKLLRERILYSTIFG